jgi:hypothetical protein
MKKIIIIFSVLLFFSGSCFAKQLSEKDIKLLQRWEASTRSGLQVVEIKVLDEIAKELKRANDLKEKELRAKGIY